MMEATTIQRGKGKGRQPWRIREFLSRLTDSDTGRAMSMATIARRATTNRQTVQETVNGTRNHARTLKVLEALRCPREYLYGGNAHTIHTQQQAA